MADRQPYLTVEHVNKQYPGVKALDDVGLEAYSGESLGLIGINGAGKSTLMNVLAGEVRADGGSFRIGGGEVHIASQKDAEANHIALIHQEAMVFPSLTVAENIFIKDFGRFCGKGGINYRKMNAEARRYLGMLDSDLNPRAPVEEITAGGRQMIEIARALSRDAQIILFDEPTSSLSIKEKRKLFDIIASLKKQGKTIIYITHFIHEIKQICERVVVMMDGRVSGKCMIGEVETGDLISMMVGTEVRLVTNEGREPHADVVLEARGITCAPKVRDVSFEVRRGEVLGLWGLLGSGRSEIFQAVLGLSRPVSGSLVLHGEDGGAAPVKGRQLLRQVGYVTENRHLDGLFKTMPIWKNITMPNLGRYSRLLLDQKRERAESVGVIRQLSVKTPDENVRVEQLSGGNQQKVIMARWILKHPALYFLDEPTRGVDVNAKAAIHQFILDLAAQGSSVIMISSEIEEILALCDRALIVKDGTIAGEVARGEMSNHTLMMMCVGGEE